MADKIFHTWFVEKASPVWADKIMISDSEAMNQTKFTDIANLPISTATSTAIGVVQSDIDTHEARTDNPHSVTKSQVWLSNVDNTSDSTKNSATATLTNKTITSPVINTPTGIVKSDVGLWNVDNTTDALKPISTATQTALNAKQDTITGLTASGAELNILDGATLSTTELNYVDWVTSNIQTQLDTKSSLTQIQDNTKQDLSLALTPNYDAINGAIVLDSSKNHYHGTVSGATYVPNGWLNGWGVYDFDGVDDYIELNDGMTIKSLLFTESTTPTGIDWKPDGTILYIVASSTDDKIYSFTCSTPWNVDTWVLRSSFSLATWTNDPTWIKWNNDGTKAYVISNQADDIKYFTAWTAYDETTLSYVGAYSTGITWTVLSLTISPSGTDFYFTENGSDIIYQHIMSTPWDMSTASSVRSQSVSWFDTALWGVDFKPDGTMMWIVWGAGDDVTEFSLWTAWNISTLTETGITFYVWAQEPAFQYGMEFWDSGNKLYIVSRTAPARIYQYNLYSPYSFSNPMYSNGFTIIADIKADSQWEGTARIYDKSISSSSISGVTAYMNTSNRITMWCWNGSQINLPNSSITFWTPYRFAFSVNSSWALVAYLNWAQVATGTTWLPSQVTDIVNSRIGNRAWATDRTYDGYIWPVRIISRVLTATEVANDYLQRTEIDNPPEVPRLTTAMRDVMTPSLGQQIYNTTTNKSQVYNGAWNDLY